MGDSRDVAGKKRKRPGATAGNRILPAVGEILLWWVVADAVWLASLSSFTLSELVIAAVWTLPCVTALRSVHSGHIGDYVAWMYAGLALLAGVLLLQLRQPAQLLCRA